MVAAAERARCSVVAGLEGALLRDAGTFPYFMLVAFEASGLPRFAALLALWPALRAMELLGRGDLALCAAAFVATVGVPRAEVEAVARAVLPKFMADDVDMAAWAAFGACGGRRVVVTRMPRVMVERFAREHLGAHEVVGSELEYSRLMRSTGVVRGGGEEAVADSVRALFADGDQPDLGLGRPELARSFLPFCKHVYAGATPAAVLCGRPGGASQRPSVPAGNLPRRPPRVPPHAAHVPRHPPLAPPRRARRLRPHRRRHRRPHPHRPPPCALLRRRHHHARPRPSPRQRQRRGRLTLRRPLRLHAPDAHGPGGPRDRPQPPRGRRDLLHLPPLGDPLADPDGAADARPGRGRGTHARRAVAGRRGRVPRGHDVPGALPAPVLCAVRRAQRPDRARGDELPRRALPPDDGEGVEGHGPHLLLHEPEAGLRGDVPEPAPGRSDVRGGEEPRRRRQLRAEDTRGHARVRVHQPHAQGQVPRARRQRRHRQRQARDGDGASMAALGQGGPRVLAALITRSMERHVAQAYLAQTI